jgi:hypothetical protein
MQDRPGHPRQDSPGEASSPSLAWPRRRPRWLLTGAAVLLGAAVWLAVSLLQSDATPPLTEEAFESARRLWAAQELGDYDLERIDHVDRAAGQNYRVVVRSRAVVELRLNGTRLEPNGSYSVEGLFETMERELEMLAQGVARERRNARLLASFHPTLGFPVLFKVIAPQLRSYFIRIEELRAPERGILYRRGGA